MALKARMSVGLDVGSKLIKVVELNYTGKIPELVNLSTCERTIAKGRAGVAFAEEQAKLAEDIRRVVDESNIKTNRVTTAVSGQSVIVRYIELPRMTPEETKKAVRFEAEQHIPFDLAEVILDFQILSPAGSDNKKMKVLLVAAKKELIENHVATIQKANLVPVIIDVESFALINEYMAEYERERKGADETVALLNIGGLITSINILRNGISQFTRDIFLAGDNLTEAIAKGLDVDFKEAERLKKEKGDALADSEIGHAFISVLEELASEIRLSFDYFENQSMAKGINSVLLTGGSANLRNLSQFFSNVLGIQTMVRNPLAQINISETLSSRQDLRESLPSLAVAVGLALRGAED